MGTHLSIDGTSLSNGELYTIVTDKAAKGKKGAPVAIVAGTGSEDVNAVLDKVPEEKLNMVEEVTLDMSESMRKIVRHSFPKAQRVIDRFHVQKLAFDAIQEMRIAHRWDAINQETDGREKARLAGKKYESGLLPNGDGLKQLLARSRYLLFKSPDKRSGSQKQRVELPFKYYPDLKQACSLTHSPRMIYNKNTHKDVAGLSLAKRYNKVTESDFKPFNTIAATVYEHYKEILDFFIMRSTNASAESFYAKIKNFRASLRGVNDIDFFLFGLSKIFA
jgi:transposase